MCVNMDCSIELSSKASRSDFWRRWVKLLLTIAAQNIIVYGVNLLDNIMIGKLGEAAELAISGVFIVNQIQFLLQSICGSISDGTVVICSRYWGEGDTNSIKRAGATSMLFGLAVSGVMMLTVLLFPTQVLGLLTDKPHVIAEGEKYLLIVAFTYMFFAATQVLLGILRSVETAFIGFINSCAAFVVNLVLNYAFIFGHFGAPAMGIRGAAIATLVSRVVEFAIVVVYIAFFDKKLKLKISDFLKFDGDISKKFFKVSLPVVFSGASWGVAMSLQTAILGRLTDPVISANSIASTVFQIMSVFIYGAATASSVMVGKTIGEAKTMTAGMNEESAFDLLKKELKHRVSRMQLIYLAMGAVTGLAIFLCRDFIVSLYDISEETKGLAMQFMAVLSVTVIGTAYQMTCLTGIVRGGGDTNFVFYNDIIFMWCIVLPCSFIAAFVLELSPIFIFMILKSDQIIKCIVAVIKVNRYRWIKKF